MDQQGLPDNLMAGDEVVTEWQNKNAAGGWGERQWNDEYDEESGMSIKEDVEYKSSAPKKKFKKDEIEESLQSAMLVDDPFQVTEADLMPTAASSPPHASSDLGEGFPKPGQCIYVQWEDDGSSEEAPGWYFGTIEAVTPDNLFDIAYSDGATEILDLTKVNFVIAKPGSKFYSQTKPKVYKTPKAKTPRTPKPKTPRLPKAKATPKQKKVHQEHDMSPYDHPDHDTIQAAPLHIPQQMMNEQRLTPQRPPQQGGSRMTPQRMTPQRMTPQRMTPVTRTPAHQEELSEEDETYQEELEGEDTAVMYAEEEELEDEGQVTLELEDPNGPEHYNTDQFKSSQDTAQVERYDGRIISSEQMMMGQQISIQDQRQQELDKYQGRMVGEEAIIMNEQMLRQGRVGTGSTGPSSGRDVENYQQIRFDKTQYNDGRDGDQADDLERLQGRLITEDNMNMLEDKDRDGEDGDEYSGDDEQDPRMPRRRGKYVRKTAEELDQVPRPWSCEFCPRAFPNKYHLQIHLRTHTGEKPYRCTECDMAFSHSSNLCSHIRTHNGIKPYKCEYCDKEFGRSNNMKAHTRIHTGEKPFECRFCGKAFRFGNHLTIHERSHTGERPYKCSYCDRAFRNSSNLRTHERLHTDERPYRCRYCDRAFSGSGNLHAHERVHTGERPFVCDVCNKAFSQSSTLRIHQRIHTGDKRYQCSLCGRRFIQSNHLKTHLRRMHHIDDSLPNLRTMHKAPDPYGMQPLNPNNFRVATKQEPEELDHSFDNKFDRMAERDHSSSQQKPVAIKSKPLISRQDVIPPSPLVVDDDVRTKSWGNIGGPNSPLMMQEEIEGGEEN